MTGARPLWLRSPHVHLGSSTPEFFRRAMAAAALGKVSLYQFEMLANSGRDEGMRSTPVLREDADELSIGRPTGRRIASIQSAERPEAATAHTVELWTGDTTSCGDGTLSIERERYVSVRIGSDRRVKRFVRATAHDLEEVSAHSPRGGIDPTHAARRRKAGQQ